MATIIELAEAKRFIKEHAHSPTLEDDVLNYYGNHAWRMTPEARQYVKDVRYKTRAMTDRQDTQPIPAKEDKVAS